MGRGLNSIFFFLFGLAIITELLGLFTLLLLIQSSGKVYEIIIPVAVLKIIVCQLTLERKLMHTLSKREKKA